MPKKGLAGEPQQDGAIFPDRPKHPQTLEVRVRFTQDMDTQILKLFKVIHGVPLTDLCNISSTLQITHNSSYALIEAHFIRLYHNLWIVGRFVHVIDACEVL
jgi:hypothetical protein